MGRFITIRCKGWFYAARRRRWHALYRWPHGKDVCGSTCVRSPSDSCVKCADM